MVGALLRQYAGSGGPKRLGETLNIQSPFYYLCSFLYRCLPPPYLAPLLQPGWMVEVAYDDAPLEIPEARRVVYIPAETRMLSLRNRVDVLYCMPPGSPAEYAARYSALRPHEWCTQTAEMVHSHRSHGA